MKNLLKQITFVFLGTLLLVGCSTKTPDYTSTINTNSLKYTTVSIGEDGTQILAKHAIYTGDIVFYPRKDGIEYDEEKCIHTIPKNKDGIIVKHFSDGNTALIFSTGTVAYGKIKITNKKKKVVVDSDEL